VPLDWRTGALAEGLACYRNEEFFLAHEHWERVWLGLDGAEKSVVQALIQMTAAFHHLRAGNRAGAASLLRRALRRLDASPPQFAGIAVAPLRAEVKAWLRGLEDQDFGLPEQCPQIRPADPD
jgi:predicted metal-dependent hydrolase